MKVKLNLNERLALMKILPAKENLINMRAIKKAINFLSVDESEHKDYEIVQNGDGKFSWNAKKAESVLKEFEFGEIAEAMVKREMKALDEKKEMEPVHVSLFEKFVEGKHDSN